MNKLVVTIVGGGSSAHTLIPMLSAAGHRVNLLTRRPSEWSKQVITRVVAADGSLQQVIKGDITTVSRDPNRIIPRADAIILCMPVSRYRNALSRVFPHIRREKKVYLGAVYAQGGFDWMVNAMLREHSMQNVIYFGFALIPWICRTQSYGSTGINYGAKKVNIAAVSDPVEFPVLDSLLFQDMCFKWFGQGRVERADNFLSLTMSADNQVIHPSRLYGLYLENPDGWQREQDVPLFYRDYDQLSAGLLEELDRDYEAIRHGIRALFTDVRFRYMLGYLPLERLTYGSANTSIRESFVYSETLAQIGTPVIPTRGGRFAINTDHRFFHDDLFYGIAIAKWIAQELQIETPMVDKLMGWAQALMGQELIRNGSLTCWRRNRDRWGVPPVYGIHDVKEILG